MARFANETKQEQRSRGQLRDRLADYGWPVHSLNEPDLGEDFLLHVYENGEATGLSALLQVKSTGDIGDIEDFRLKGDPSLLRYRLEVKDLEHWEHHLALVVLVLWDVVAKTGFWVTIPDAIDELERDAADWRSKDKVRVTVSIGNGTDDRGLALLRRAIVEHWRPLMATGNGRPETISFLFPSTQEGNVALQAYKNWLERGDSIVVDGQFVAGLKGPILGRLLPKDAEVVSLALGTPISEDIVMASIEVERGLDFLHFPCVDLRVVKNGSRCITLSNERQGVFVIFNFVFDKPQDDDESVVLHFGFSLREGGRSLHEASTGARLALLLKLGSTVRIIQREHGAVILEHLVRMTVHASEEMIRADVELFDRLIAIQRRVSGLARLRFPGRPMRLDEVKAIEKLDEICRSGRIRCRATLTVDLDSSALDLAQLPGRSDGGLGTISFVTTEPPIELWGTEIPLGAVRTHVLDATSFLSQIREKLSAANEKSPTLIEVSGVDVEREFVDWLDGKTPALGK
jgi:hypothetical protein